MLRVSRVFATAAVLSVLTSVVVLFVPEAGVLGPAPSTSDALSWFSDAVQQPLFLVPFALGLALYGLGKMRKPPELLLRAPTALKPLPQGLTKAQKFEATQVAFGAQSTGADGLVLAELMVQAGVRLGASDIHLHPTEDGANLSLRVDGSLEPLGRVTGAQYALLINRLKVLGRLTHYVTDAPQDGQFVLDTPDGRAEVRISLLPTQHGEKAVMRIAGLGNAGPRLDALNLPQSVRAQLTHMLDKPQGLIFFTGPTGSGKTTSIYASVAHLQQTRGALAQITTIEDPIELALDGVAQTQVNRGAGLDFATGLRAILRQDPNVLVVGEIRDVETARIATQAALTGHLILTTVHADSAVGVFNRLLEMGVEPSVVASVSLACFSQRLLRQLCPHCRQPQEPTAEQKLRLSALGAPLTGYSSSKGCDECAGTGVLGRAAVFEVLVMNDELRETLKKSPSTQQLMSMAVEGGLVPLREAALKRAREGEVSLAEALRVAE